jgi:hypothetical protein
MATTQINRRRVLALVLGLALFLIWTVRLGFSSTWESTQASIASSFTGTSIYRPLPHVEDYFEQVFSAHDPPNQRFSYPGLKDACERAPWDDEEVYLLCEGMHAGLTSIVSQVKVCLKMAVDTGSNLVLPSMPLRDANNLSEYNLLNQAAHLTYDKWFDAAHLRAVMHRACPRMKIVHPDQLDHAVGVKHRWRINVGDALFYQKVHSYFWVGRPFRSYFEDKYRELKEKDEKDPVPTERGRRGITVINIDSEFLLFRITDDPTGRDRRLWNDLSHAIRFRPEPRQIIARLMPRLPRTHFGVHFRAEGDTIWSSAEVQMGRDLDMLDQAWKRYGKEGDQKPLVYLACGDLAQVDMFSAKAAERGWEVTHKWKLVEGDAETLRMIESLAFDFQGVIDMGLMVRSQFFIGITGSAFSSTIANQRDITGRYRGSSLMVPDDEGSKTHLFNDLDADEYACCL